MADWPHHYGDMRVTAVDLGIMMQMTALAIPIES